MNLKYILPLIILVPSVLGKCLCLVLVYDHSVLLPRVTKLKEFYLTHNVNNRREKTKRT